MSLSIADSIEQLVKDVTAELMPYLDGIRVLEATSKKFQIFQKNYNYFIKKYDERKKIFDFRNFSG